jgi:hypothetical protein
MSEPGLARSHEQFARSLDEAAVKYRLYPPQAQSEDGGSEIPIRELRRRRGGSDLGACDLVTIADVMGVLRWRPGPWSPHLEEHGGATTRIIRQYRVSRSRFSDDNRLGLIDRALNPLLTEDFRMLFLTKLLELEPSADVPKAGRFLLFVHGAFSSGRRIVAQLRSRPEGKAFLEEMRRSYDNVLFFEHSTVSSGALMNAVQLSLLFRRSQAKVDVISHGRGGLVTRWWLEVLESHDRLLNGSLFIGCPLFGTSQSNRSGTSQLPEVLLNVGRFDDSTTTLVPWLEAAMALVRVVASGNGSHPVTQLPGIACQSDVDNREIDWLGELFDRSASRPLGRYFAVTATLAAADASNGMSVHGRANDLIVASADMTRLSPRHVIPEVAVLHFGPHDGVHHGNYLAHPDTLAFVRKVFNG